MHTFQQSIRPASPKDDEFKKNYFRCLQLELKTLPGAWVSKPVKNAAIMTGSINAPPRILSLSWTRGGGGSLAGFSEHAPHADSE